MSNPWTQHLEKYDLLDLHNKAEHVGYRVRAVNDWEIHLEYQAGLPKYCQSPYALMIFENTDEGRREVRALLAGVQADIEIFRSEARLTQALKELNDLSGIDVAELTETEYDYSGELLANLFEEFQRANVRVVFDYQVRTWSFQQ